MNRLHVTAALSMLAAATLGAACGSSAVESPAPTGDCTIDRDCGGSSCAEVTPGGYKICLGVTDPPEATQCTAGNQDLCCSSMDCVGGGKCYDQAKLPACGGPAPAAFNACIGDACQSDADCVDSEGIPRFCAPAGAWGNPVRACVNAHCKTNADCTAAPGGGCVPIRWTCCSTPLGLACVYPGGCTSDEDCGADGTKACAIEDGKGQCVTMAPGCPE